MRREEDRLEAAAGRKKSSVLMRGESLIDMESGRPIMEQVSEALGDSFARVIDIFREWDEDGSGTISRKEFGKALPVLGVRLTPAQLSELFHELDEDGSGLIEYDELHKKLRKKLSPSREPAPLSTRFWPPSIPPPLRTPADDPLLGLGTAGTLGQSRSPAGESRSSPWRPRSSMRDSFGALPPSRSPPSRGGGGGGESPGGRRFLFQSLVTPYGGAPTPYGGASPWRGLESSAPAASLDMALRSSSTIRGSGSELGDTLGRRARTPRRAPSPVRNSRSPALSPSKSVKSSGKMAWQSVHEPPFARDSEGGVTFTQRERGVWQAEMLAGEVLTSGVHVVPFRIHRSRDGDGERMLIGVADVSGEYGEAERRGRAWGLCPFSGGLCLVDGVDTVLEIETPLMAGDLRGRADGSMVQVAPTGHLSSCPKRAPPSLTSPSPIRLQSPLTRASLVRPRSADLAHNCHPHTSAYPRSRRCSSSWRGQPLHARYMTVTGAHRPREVNALVLGQRGRGVRGGYCAAVRRGAVVSAHLSWRRRHRAGRARRSRWDDMAHA